MNGTVTVDIAGAQMGGAARYAAELHRYLARTGRQDVQVIGAGRHVGPAWLLQREIRSGRQAAGSRSTMSASSVPVGSGGPCCVMRCTS